ncbi:MAG: cupin domain-containing protein [Chloroflexi bacterium]|nr:cupin domain-containing protein [Chloroflexota bacterium]
MAFQNVDRAAELESFYTNMDAQNLEGLWRVAHDVLTPEPTTVVQPYLWRWENVARVTHEAGRLVPLERGGERRAVALVNPGLRGKFAATDTLYAAIQLIRPGELAPPHRHTPTAIRFIIQGEGATTTVESEKITMNEGDLILTPNWTWHEHRNEGTEDVLWLDGLDIPLIRSLSSIFFESFPEDSLPLTTATDYSTKAFGSAAVKPVGYKPAAKDGSMLMYRWPGVQRTLESLRNEVGTAHDGMALEYINPHTGGHTLPTMSCWMQMLRPDEHTQAHRHTPSVIYYAFKGNGSTIIDGLRFDWGAGDSFVVPPWRWHEHVNASASEDALLFSMNDGPVMEAFGLLREESYSENGGQQRVTGVFDG